MQYTYQMMILQKMYPMLTWDQMNDIAYYWRAFYENPRKYKNTAVETAVFSWVEGRRYNEEVRV